MVPISMPIRIFIVEDSPVILDRLSTALEQTAGLRVVGTAADETTALRLLSERGNEVDIVIVDIFLEHGSGLGVLSGMVRAGIDVPRIVATNYTPPELRALCMRLGALQVFDKSTELDELISYCAGWAHGYDDARPAL